MEYSKFKKVTLKRTACFGSCPVFKVEIFADGLVKYYGEIFVKEVGKKTWSLTPDQIDAITRINASRL